jgi:hypothetical protein
MVVPGGPCYHAAGKASPGRYHLRFMHDVTHLLSALDQGDPHAASQLLPLVYDELRKLAARRMAQEQPSWSANLFARP